MDFTFDLILRIFVGGLLGGVIGFERELRAKEAGFRTHFLVALGSALLSVISAYGYDKILLQYPDASFDPSRVTAQIVSGIGFIGAGLIIFQKNVVHGLTTAAGLWVTSAIGITCGVGHYDYAISSTVMVLIALEAILFFDHKCGRKQIMVKLSSEKREKLLEIVENLKRDGIRVNVYEMDVQIIDGIRTYKASLSLHVKRSDYEMHVLELMGDVDGAMVENIK